MATRLIKKKTSELDSSHVPRVAAGRTNGLYLAQSGVNSIFTAHIAEEDRVKGQALRARGTSSAGIRAHKGEADLQTARRNKRGCVNVRVKREGGGGGGT